MPACRVYVVSGNHQGGGFLIVIFGAFSEPQEMMSKRRRRKIQNKIRAGGTFARPTDPQSEIRNLKYARPAGFSVILNR